MNIFRIYGSKENTIASGSAFELLNSSQNPVADLWYGGKTTTRNSISRHLIQFDLSGLESRLDSKEINADYVSAYKLKFTNCIPSDTVLDTEYEFDILNKKVAASFDLIAFPINKSWDEGRGFDLTEQHLIIRSKGSYTDLTGYSNWISATSSTDWDEPGIFTDPTGSTAVTNYVSQHFAIGSENLEMDVTDIVKDWLSGGSDNNGMALSYSRPFELESADTRFISSFYTNKTNTSFKPYLEVQYDQVIKDDRHQVANNRTSRLFLYLFSGNSAVNFYSAGTVSITTNADVDVYTGLTPVNHSKGVYYVDVLMSGTTKGQAYKDVWQDITFQSGVDVQTFTQKFTIKGNYYTNSNKELDDYIISSYGIDNDEALLPGEVRRVFINARMNYSLKKPIVDYGLEYRMTMNNVDEVIPWTQVNSTIINGCYQPFFDVDTSWLLDNQTYEIIFRANNFGAKKILEERINFKVIDSFTKVKA